MESWGYMFDSAILDSIKAEWANSDNSKMQLKMLPKPEGGREG